jgi:hypothetical protein
MDCFVAAAPRNDADVFRPDLIPPPFLGQVRGMAARIFREEKNAMQSGKARTGSWVLEHESGSRRRPDPLMGWSGGADTQTQVRLTFPTLEAAKAYAEREGIEVHVVPTADRS